MINDKETLQAIATRRTGKQVELDIAGHTFFVDSHWGVLRPKDDFMSKGIWFKDIEDNFSSIDQHYYVAYDPQKHEAVKLNYKHLESWPEQLLMVKFPHQKVLDPIGYNKSYGFPELSNVKKVRMKHSAETVDVQKTGKGIFFHPKSDQTSKATNKSKRSKKL